MSTMRGLVLGIGAATLLSGAALAADVLVKKAPAPAPAPATPVFDIAFGAAVMTDYNFRGVSQSNRQFSASAYFEAQYNSPVGTFYAGLAGYRINWPTTFGFTNPAAEIDITGGWRNKWGAFSLDIGGIYYWYPNETFNGFTNDSDFWEVYLKPSYEVNSDVTLGLNVAYTPDLLHYSRSFAAVGVAARAAAVYASVTGKWVLPWKSGDLGAYVSGELGHWWIRNTGFILAGPALSGAPYVDPSYLYWNAGIAFTWKMLTLDLRYHGNDMNNLKCASFLLSAVGNPSNRWCRQAFIASLKIDTSLSALGIVK